MTSRDLLIPSVASNGYVQISVFPKDWGSGGMPIPAGPNLPSPHPSPISISPFWSLVSPSTHSSLLTPATGWAAKCPPRNNSIGTDGLAGVSDDELGVLREGSGLDICTEERVKPGPTAESCGRGQSLCSQDRVREGRSGDQVWISVVRAKHHFWCRGECGQWREQLQGGSLGTGTGRAGGDGASRLSEH